MRGAVDCNPEGRIIFDYKSKEGKHFLKSYGGKGLDDGGLVQDMSDQELKGDKSILKLYKSYVVEVKVKSDAENVRRTESTLQIYDFDNKMLLMRTQFPGQEITQVEIENDSLLVVLLDAERNTSKFVQLVEVGDRQKIETLLREQKFLEARGVAQNWVEAKDAANSHLEEICAEISKKHADHLYDEKNRADLALDSYIDTIGFLNPSYVI